MPNTASRPGSTTAREIYRATNGVLTPVIAVDYLLHTPANPFCSDPACLCHEDETLIAETMVFVNDGLFTPDEATRFIRGEMREG